MKTNIKKWFIVGAVLLVTACSGKDDGPADPESPDVKAKAAAVSKLCSACIGPHALGCTEERWQKLNSVQSCISFCRSQDPQMNVYWQRGWETCWFGENAVGQ